GPARRRRGARRGGHRAECAVVRLPRGARGDAGVPRARPGLSRADQPAAIFLVALPRPLPRASSIRRFSIVPVVALEVTRTHLGLPRQVRGILMVRTAFLTLLATRTLHLTRLPPLARVRIEVVDCSPATSLRTHW